MTDILCKLLELGYHLEIHKGDDGWIYAEASKNDSEITASSHSLSDVLRIMANSAKYDEQIQKGK